MTDKEIYGLLEERYGSLNALDMGVYQRSFVSGDPGSDRLRVKYFFRINDRRLVGHAWFGPGAEGPPGFAHGGSISAVLDEAMGAASWLNEQIAVAARLTIEFKEMIPLDTQTILEAWVESIERRKVSIRATLSSFDGKIYAEGDGLFITVSMDRFDNRDGELPSPPEIIKSTLKMQE